MSIALMSDFLEEMTQFMAKSVNHITHAFWDSKDSGIIILSSDWNNSTAQPPLLLGPDNVPFKALQQVDPEVCGRYYRYYKSKQHWIFTINASRYPQLLEGKEQVYLVGDFNDWSESIGNVNWELTRVKQVAADAEVTYEIRVPVGKLPSNKKCLFKFVTASGLWLDVPDSAPNRVRSGSGAANYEFNPLQAGQYAYRFQIPAGHEPLGNEKIVWRDKDGDEVHELPHTQFLTTAFTDLELGAIVDAKAAVTTFRLFAPRASGVLVAIGQAADSSDVVLHRMTCVDGVAWEIVLDQNLDGWYYTFRVEGESHEGTSHFNSNFPILDPYAKACLSARGPGIVVSTERLPRVKHSFQPPAWQDLIILEGHVRDLAAHAPIELSAQERRGYTGLRKWLKTKGSYIKELGVNAIELQPIQEFDNLLREDYHWGYMTANYFSPESSYALEPEKASQIEEFRGLVQDFHDEGIAVILDVVYNHVGEPNHLLFVDKYYYFHVDEANDLLNWSGCGNDLRCNTPMTRRLIIESLTHLIEAYDVDGFRFDLAELIGIEVLREIEVELKRVKPSLILIAEPWSFRGHIQDELKETGFASWNDGFRESIAKYVCGKGNQDMIQYFLAGSPSSSRFAAQTINYTESHDDHCWMDRITERALHNGSDPTMLDRRRTHLMASVLFASLGVPMLAEGQDFMRSKLGISNTYQRGDVNALDYNRRLVYSGTHSYFRNWIAFRLSDLGQALRYDGALQPGYMKFFVTAGSSATVAVFNADRSIKAPMLIFAVNPHLEYANIKCDPDYFDGAVQISDQERFKVAGLKSALIPVAQQSISLPPISCGLWLVR